MFHEHESNVFRQFEKKTQFGKWKLKFEIISDSGFDLLGLQFWKRRFNEFSSQELGVLLSEIFRKVY